MKNKMEDLRNILFETLEMLRDKDIDVERAKAIANVGKVLVDSAKVEVTYLQMLDKGGEESPNSLLQPAKLLNK